MRTSTAPTQKSKGKKRTGLGPRAVRLTGGRTAAAALLAPQAPSDTTEELVDTSKTKSAHLTLEAGCTLRDAIDMQFILLAADTTDEQIVVDGGMVEHVDTAGLQLLVAFARRQRAAGHAVHWVRVSDVLRTASARLGLDAELALGNAPKGNAT